MNLATIDGMTELEAFFGEKLREEFHAKGRATPAFAVVMTFDPETGHDFPEPKFAVILSPEMAGGETFAEFERRRQVMVGYLQAFIKATKAIGVISGMEVWRSSDPKFRGRSFEEDPNREEILITVAEHVKFAARMKESRIVRDAAGKGTAEPFRPSDAVKVEGRFAELLDRTRFA